MPLSLNLPYPVCYLLTRVARRLRSSQATAEGDQRGYFLSQYSNTHSRYVQHMSRLDLAGRRVLDVGCGLGGRALAWLDLGAEHVINVDINRQELAAGEKLLAEFDPQRSACVTFCHPDDLADEAPVADVAILFDCFEHLADPGDVLRQLDGWLRPGALTWIGSIGWYNYTASHCINSHIPIPWCQLLFSEKAILKTIRRLLHSRGYQPNMWERIEGLDRWDSVTTLRDRPGEPLNMLSLRDVRRLLEQSPFELQQFRTFGFGGKRHKLARLAAPLAGAPLLCEVFHSYYTALLAKPSVPCRKRPAEPLTAA